MGEQKENIKEDLNRHFTDEYINNLGMLLMSNAEKYYQMNGLEGKVYFNDDIFNYCLVDILEDLARLKSFHNIELVNYTKIIAYASSWILKRKPFQLVEGCDKKYRYVNEKFAWMLLLHGAGLKDSNVQIAKDDLEIVKKNLEHLFYHLKYRNINPQTLELLLVGVQTGIIATPIKIDSV